MNITELELKYKELGAEIERLKQAENDGRPSNGQEYWWLNSELDRDCATWRNCRGDIARWDAGNVFLTEQEAINARDFKLAIMRINREIDRLNKLENWVADFSNTVMGKYYPTYTHNSSKWEGHISRAGQVQFTFKYGSERTIESVLKSHATDLDIVKKCGVM